MKIAYLPIGAALSLMLMLAALPKLGAGRLGHGNSARATTSAAQQLSQNESSDSGTNSQGDQPDDSAASTDNPDQSSAQTSDENGASSESGPPEENSGESSQMNSNPYNSDNSDRSSPNPDNDQQNQDSGDTR